MLKIIILSGAGISAESGINTFRDTNGLWESYVIEDVATPQAWRKNPDLVQSFYNARRKQVMEAQPNDAHRYFARLENRFDVHIVTQNIDDLHERAGSSKILHLHGNIRFAKSSGPNVENTYFPIEGTDITTEDLCSDGYPLRPHVVWFGESVPMLEPAAELCEAADVIVVIGTSLQVYPAASLAFLGKKSCIRIVIDPKAEEMQVGNEFIKLPYNAVEGVQVLDRLWEKIL